MFLSLEPGERLETRTRPARRPRWRAYTPGVGLAVAGLAFAFVASPVTSPRLGVELTVLGTVGVAAGMLALVTAIAWALGRPPLLTLVVGATAVSAGANLWSGGWAALPLVVAGLAWVGLLELQRAANGLALTNQRVVLPRILRKPLAIPFADVRVVHTTANGGPIGSLILETAHGTLAAPDLPGALGLKARIEARMNAVPVAPEPASMAEARGRIERVLAGARRAGGERA